MFWSGYCSYRPRAASRLALEGLSLRRGAHKRRQRSSSPHDQPERKERSVGQCGTRCIFSVCRAVLPPGSRHPPMADKRDKIWRKGMN